jgi:hypothetical protein
MSGTWAYFRRLNWFRIRRLWTRFGEFGFQGNDWWANQNSYLDACAQKGRSRPPRRWLIPSEANGVCIPCENHMLLT